MRLIDADELRKKIARERGAWKDLDVWTTAIDQALYVVDSMPAAEANQAPGPDWKAKLRGEVEASRDEANGHGYRAGLTEALVLIDALPDPPTPDEAVRTSGAKLVSGPGTFDEFASLKVGEFAQADFRPFVEAIEFWVNTISRCAPVRAPWFVPPEGHVAPVLGENVRDGWEGHYVLLPPPGLVAAPEGMDGGGWLGVGRHVPEGWPWRDYSNPTRQWIDDLRPFADHIVQCRPPVRVRAVVEVPLTRLVGRTIEGEKRSVARYRCETAAMPEWTPFTTGHAWHPFPDGTLDLDTGRVKVEPEGEQ